MERVRAEVARRLAEQRLPPSATLLVAVSGGQDSVCLLDVLAGLRAPGAPRLVVFHLDHRLRGDRSAADAAAVGRLAAAYGLELCLWQVEVRAYAQAQGLGLEAAGHLARYQALRADMAASGEESLQVGQLKASPMGSWIGLYALLSMIRDAGMTEFTRDGITAMLESATDVPMLGMFGDQSWTPDADSTGLWQRVGTTHWATYRWDPEAEAPDGLEGNFVETSTIDLAEVLCGSPFGAPEPC